MISADQLDTIGLVRCRLKGTYKCMNPLPAAYRAEAPKPEQWLQFLSELLYEEPVLWYDEYASLALLLWRENTMSEKRRDKRNRILHEGEYQVLFRRKMSLIKSYEKMTKILFVCHGNICRSPMAEFVMKDMTERASVSSKFYIESAATSTEEIGNPVYPPARRKMAEYGIDCSGKTARQITKADYARYDLIIGMDSANIRNMLRIFGSDPDGKIHKLMDYTSRHGDVADPWYTGDFEETWIDVNEGCRGLLTELGYSEFGK